LRLELNRLEELKRINIEKFIANIRAELDKLWDQCYYSQPQR
jgi:Microtubule associated protein (MAP65/ASE1 family)